MHTKSTLNFEGLKLEALVNRDLRNVFVPWVILRLGHCGLFLDKHHSKQV